MCWGIVGGIPGSHGDPTSELFECLSDAKPCVSPPVKPRTVTALVLPSLPLNGKVLSSESTRLRALRAQPGDGSLSIHLQDRQAGQRSSTQRRGWCPPPARVQEAGLGCLSSRNSIVCLRSGSGAVAIAGWTGGRQAFRNPAEGTTAQAATAEGLFALNM